MKEATTNFRELISGKLSNNKATSTNKDGSVTQYGVTNASLLYANTQYIDAATKAALYQWFASRIINTEEQESFATGFDQDGIPNEYYNNLDFGKFIRFFNTELLNDEYRYKELLRIERTQFDPMVANYLEEWSKDTHTGEHNSNSTGSENPALVNETTTRTDNLHKSIEGSDSKTTTFGSKATTNLTHTTNETDTFNPHVITEVTTQDETLDPTEDTQTYDGYKVTDTNNQSSMAKNLPNSISYPEASQNPGVLPALNWNTGSGQNQAKAINEHEVEGSSTNTHSHNNQVTSTTRYADGSYNENIKTGGGSTSGDLWDKSGQDVVSGTNGSTEANTGTQTSATTRTLVTSGGKTDISNGSDSYENEHKEVHTGRTNILPQEAMPKAINYIKNSRAFDWLKGELDSCFLQIL